MSFSIKIMAKEEANKNKHKADKKIHLLPPSKLLENHAFEKLLSVPNHLFIVPTKHQKQNRRAHRSKQIETRVKQFFSVRG